MHEIAKTAAAPLRLEGVAHSVSVRSGRRVLFDGLDLELRPGAVTAVIGPNGAGKSTLLRQVAGLATPERGRVCWGGVAVHAMPPRARARHIAYLPQHTLLAFDLRVEELVVLGRAPHLGRFTAPSERDRQAVAAALALVEADHLVGRMVSSLSGGERQRVLLARLLATEASVLVLDEPTTSLDIGHTLSLLALCRSLARDGRTVIAALHELELCRRYADTVLCLTGTGAHHAGPVAEVMTPRVLEPTFGVGVVTSEHGIQLVHPNDRT